MFVGTISNGFFYVYILYSATLAKYYVGVTSVDPDSRLKKHLSNHSAIALTDMFWAMAVVIVISGMLMIFLADVVSNFFKKNRMYEVLGLFVLFVVGIMLVTEGAHLAHIKLFGEKIVSMSKTTFYFILIIMVADIVQGRYQKKIVIEKERMAAKLEKLENAAK